MTSKLVEASQPVEWSSAWHLNIIHRSNRCTEVRLLSLEHSVSSVQRNQRIEINFCMKLRVPYELVTLSQTVARSCSACRMKSLVRTKSLQGALRVCELDEPSKLLPGAQHVERTSCIVLKLCTELRVSYELIALSQTI